MIFSEKFLTPVALWLGLIPSPMPPPAAPPTVTILCYHTFSERSSSAFAMAPDRFNEQMRFLAIQKIPVIPLAEAVDHLRLGKPIPDGSVVITIDDGYKTARNVALPILHKYGFPFTVYVYPQAISHLRAYMTWDDLRFMDHLGVDVESHTMTHPLLTHPGKVMNPKEYEAWLWNELAGSRKMLEAQLHKPIRHLAYSYGGYDGHVVAVTKAAGYWSATTCDTMNVTRHANPLLLGRRLIFRQTSFKQFVEGLRARELQVTQRQPGDGDYLPALPKEIKVKVLNVRQLMPGTLRIRMDHVKGGWHPMAFDPATQIARYPVPPVSHRGYFFISLRADDKAHPNILHETTWLFITRKNVSKK